MGFLSKDVGIDLGTANTLVYMKGKGIIMREPSVVAVDTKTDEVRCVGGEAKAVIGRTPGSIVAVRPLKDGVIADFDITTNMLENFLKKACGNSMFSRPRVVICIPSGVTEVERRAVREATLKAGARQVSVIEEPMAAAIDAALGTYQDAGIDFDRDAIRAEVADFFVTRTKVMLRDGGCSHDTMDAVLATGVEEPAQIIARTYVLEAERLGAPEAFDDLATAYARANNLRDADLGVEVDEALLSDAERALLAATDEAAACVKEALAVDHFGAALAALAALRAPIDAFFEDVLIMDDDLALRENRLRLLNRFVAVFAHVADFGKMAKGAK